MDLGVSERGEFFRWNGDERMLPYCENGVFGDGGCWGRDVRDGGVNCVICGSGRVWIATGLISSPS